MIVRKGREKYKNEKENLEKDVEAEITVIGEHQVKGQATQYLEKHLIMCYHTKT